MSDPGTRMAELRGILLGGAGAAAGPKPIEPLAQAMELRERFSRLRPTGTFVPGALIRSKAGLGLDVPRFRVVSIVIRHLDLGNPYDCQLATKYVRDGDIGIAALPPDLVVGDIYQNKEALLGFRLVASARMEEVTDAMLADWPLPPGSASDE